ncbi:hypothetical protein DNTS_018395 [Danionella cerebrum]|uniref:Uncharacterized protein n=1 Tax=Danionella cerebrum TaxID=2873325 RepID=A0A553NGD0_9TELE|nr:hypothetical protein DNTS_018395 [Danionella translucida]
MAQLNLGPLYVISITLVDGDVERNLPEVHIPQYLTYLNAEIIVRLVEEALDKLSHYPLTPGPGFNPLLDLLEENGDYWTVEMDSGGDSLAVSFCPVHNTVPQETERPQQGPEVHPSASGSAASLGERSSDSEQPAASGQNNGEAGSRRSNTSTEQNQAGTMEESKRKRKTNDTSEATETKRRKTDQLPETDIGSSPPSSSDEISFDNKQPGPSGLNNHEIWAHQHQSSTSQEDDHMKKHLERMNSLGQEKDAERAQRENGNEIWILIQIKPAFPSAQASEDTEALADSCEMYNKDNVK